MIICHCQRGIIEDDNDYDPCLAMAASRNMPPQLRHRYYFAL